MIIAWNGYLESQSLYYGRLTEQWNAVLDVSAVPPAPSGGNTYIPTERPRRI